MQLWRGFIIWILIVSSIFAGNKFRRVCYYSSWAIYRPGTGKFTPSDIDPFLCTHIIYAFAKLNEETFTLDTFDSWADLAEDYGLGGYSKVMALRMENTRLKIMLSVGGWNAGSVSFSNMVSTAHRRKTFIESAIQYLRKYKFDGLDINWEFPGVRGGRESDKGNFGLFLQEFRTVIDAEPSISGKSALILSAAVSASPKTVETAYNISSIPRSLDFVSIMTYDFHGSWDTNVAHHSPIYGRHRDPMYPAGYDMVSAVKLWLNGGCPPDKIVVGVPLYGRSFTLADAQKTSPGSTAASGGEPGPFTREPGFLAYFEVCSLLMDNTWTVVTDPEERTPYAHKEDQWIGYDDIDSVIRKTVIVREWGLGGVMVWSVDMDDFRGLCSSQAYPLLRMIKKVLEFQPLRALNPLPAFPPATSFYTSPPNSELSIPARLLPPVQHAPSQTVTIQATAPTMEPSNQQGQERRVAAPSSGLRIDLPQSSFFLHEHHHQAQPAFSNILPLFTPQPLPHPAPSVNPWFQQTSAPPQQPFDFGILMNFNALGPVYTHERPEPTFPPQTVAPRQNFVGTTDMAVADSNLRSVSYPGERTNALRSMDCPNEGFYRNPYDCTRFYRCISSSGRWTVFHFMCPSGLVFDPSYNVCNWVNLAPSCLR